jgi:hypothetical protein
MTANFVCAQQAQLAMMTLELPVVIRHASSLVSTLACIASAIMSRA